MAEIVIPSDVKSYFVKNEKIVRTEKSAGWKIYVTNKRVIFKKQGILGKETVEASYDHVSSIEYSRQSPISWVILGIAGLVILSLEGIWIPELSVLLFLMGLLLVITVIFLVYLQKPTYTIHIVGRKPIVVSAKLEEIIKKIREYQKEVEAKSRRPRMPRKDVKKEQKQKVEDHVSRGRISRKRLVEPTN